MLVSTAYSFPSATTIIQQPMYSSADFGNLGRSEPARVLILSIQKVKRHTMRCVDRIISNQATTFKSAGSRFWAPWKVSHFPFKVMTGSSKGGKMASHTHLQFFLGQLLEPMKPRSVVHKPRFPMQSLPLMKRKERYKPKGKKNQEERQGHNQKKKLIKSGQREFYVVQKISNIVHCWCLLLFFCARYVLLF